MSSSPTDRDTAGAESGDRPASGFVPIEMPQMGVSVAEGTVLEWRKRPGDWVEADEPVCDVTTDKVDVEIPSPASGRLDRILVEPGETVAVGTPLAEIDPAARPGEAHPEESHPAEEAGGDRKRSSTVAGGDGAATTEEVDRSRFYSPVVRRIAEKHSVDLAQVRGTGIGGRVRKKDVLAHVEAAEADARPQAPLHIESPYREEEQLPASSKLTAGPEVGRATTEDELIGPTRREPMAPMRQAIAKHMVESRRTAAHCTTIVEVDFAAVARRRSELRETMARRGVKLTYLSFVARATVEALEEFPVLNASLEGADIVYHDDVNLGIAVALDDGLIVPVIRKAQRLSLEGMAVAIADVAERARAKRLDPDDVHGGTFTITNPGQFGAVLATPIINQPQVGILDLEAVIKRPVVVETEHGDAIEVRPMTYLCMSWDHRALDGAQAARFLSTIKQRLEHWGGGE